MLLRLYWSLPGCRFQVNDEGSSGDPGTGECARRVLEPPTLLELPVSDNYSLGEQANFQSSESDSIICVGLSSLCGMFSEARSILWQGQGSFSLFESSKNLFQDRCELFGVGFHRSCGGEFFPSFLESLRTIAAHSGLLPAEREGIVP